MGNSKEIIQQSHKNVIIAGNYVLMQMNNYSYQLKHIEAAGCSVSTDNSAAAIVAYSQDKCTECMQDYEEPSTKLSADAEERCSA